jgi:peptidoglycan/xylan/chitin deacetylase (PgdA/CDA1 family)
VQQEAIRREPESATAHDEQVTRAATAQETGKSRLRGLIPRRVLLALYEASPSRRRMWRDFPAQQRLATGSRQVALTFDDGPGELNERLLAQLAEHELVATFFLVGEQVRDAPGAARAIVEAGHEIALHGSAHFRHDQAAPERSREDLRRGLEEVAEVTGVAPRWYRPPFGKFSPASYDACRELGLRPVYWSTWGHDWEPVGAAHIARRTRSGLEDGAIVLLHDSARYAERTSAQPTLDALGPIASDLRSRGLRPVTLSQSTPVDPGAQS